MPSTVDARHAAAPVAGTSVADLGGAFLAVIAVTLAVLAVVLVLVLLSGTLTRRLGWLLLVLNRRTPDEQLPMLDDQPAPSARRSWRPRRRD